MKARARAIAVALALAALPGGRGVAAPQALVVGPGGAYGSIAAAVMAATPGDVVEVVGGHHPGPLVIDKPVRLHGAGEPLIDGGGRGTVVRIRAAGVEFRGFRVRGSGDSLDREDAAIYVEAPGAVIEANRVEDALFGVYLRGAAGSRVIGNHISGKELPPGRQGDGIRAWNSGETEIIGNAVRGARDVILQNSPRSRVRRNRVEGGRYGLHLMYSDGCVVEDNVLTDNSVGLYAMFSTGLTVSGNAFLENRGPSGYGLGLKDMDDVKVEGNRFLRNRVGIYIDNSPRSVGVWNTFRRNLLAGNDSGMLLQPAVSGNRFAGNAFIDNHVQVTISGAGQLAGNEWAEGGRGNYWSDYAGYDAGGDGVGELPYRNQSLFESMMDRLPALRWFIHSPAATAVDLAARAFPAVQPRPNLTDPAPLMAPERPAGVAAPRPPRSGSLLVASLAQLCAATGVLGLALRRRRLRAGAIAARAGLRAGGVGARCARGEVP